MEKYYMTKTQFAEQVLGISLSTLERREKEMNYYLPKGLLSPDDRAEFLKKLKEWEDKRREERQKKRRGEK